MGVTVVYRICDIESTNPPPIFKGDRVGLNKRCLESFVKAFSNTDISINFLCDNTGNYDEYLRDTIPFPYTVEYSNAGINYSYLKSLNVALSTNDDIFFLECDYLFKKDAGKILIGALNRFDFISPYDHPDKYEGDATLAIHDNRHWRTAVSTTMTFATKNQNIKEHYDLLSKHGYLDHQMWLELQATTGKKLWTPIPTLATHMVESCLSPGVLLTEYV